MLSVETAEGFLDLGRRVGVEIGRSQLTAGVAIYNMLETQQVAYLADEVGMGKTYVALSALALLRTVKPRTRVLVIAPSENIQTKWMNEFQNFTHLCVRYSDLRFRSLQGTPARGQVKCNNLLELVREVTLDPDRDFFARLTSFSFGLGEDTFSWEQTRDKFLAYLPWVDTEQFDLRNKSKFKDAIGRTLAQVLPRFDLVIVDEAHHLKAGFRPEQRSLSSRNRILGLAFGAYSANGEKNQPRARRLLQLSATPVEDDYRQLWNQLEMFGFGHLVPELRDDKLGDEVRRVAARRVLIRRVTELDTRFGRLTKTQYRREWRRGGVATHDLPMQTPDDSQKLTVALIQKKVSEVLNAENFNASFQIGMLASFESFLETSKLRRAGIEEPLGRFDDENQTDNLAERRGADVDIIDRIAKDFRRRFSNQELPHPKMDGLVRNLAASFKTGEKSLIFVRRVASVRELRRKLERCYDEYLFKRLRAEIAPSLLAALNKQIHNYEIDQQESKGQSEPPESDVDASGDDAQPDRPVESEGGTETFFAWFFRGEGPPKVFSGANFQRRFLSKRSAVATFFEDNHVADLLAVPPGKVFATLGAFLNCEPAVLQQTLRHRAAHYAAEIKPTRRGQFFAWQAAALELLKDGPDPVVAHRAAHVWNQRYQAIHSARPHRLPPDEVSWLEESTFFTELRRRTDLCELLWPVRAGQSFEDEFQERELRRELLASMARLGHASIDLYVLAVNHIGSLASGTREGEEGGAELIVAYLDELSRQSSYSDEWRGYRELAEAAANFDAIVDGNLPEIRQKSLNGVGRELGVLLSTQHPVGGTFGEVNRRLVKQFRMPGYPFVLAATDVLQEGEDLHLFCSRVYHYGLSWTASSMEQRVGRIDRVRSQTHRRLLALDHQPTGEEKLQVFYPHLRETVEAFQVQTVLERLNRFLRLMHEDLRTPEQDHGQLNLRHEVARGLRDVPSIVDALRTAFPVPPGFLGRGKAELPVGPLYAKIIESLFNTATEALGRECPINWIESRVGVRAGTIHLGNRLQPFSLFLRSVDGHPVVRCVSPIGMLKDKAAPEDVRDAVSGSGVRVGAVYNQDLETYDFAVEGDVLLWNEKNAGRRVMTLVKDVTEAADRAEAALLGTDLHFSDFESDIAEEPTYAR
jgi:hypothetical protein